MDYITVNDYAALHGVSRETIKKKCQNGCLKTAKKVGRDWLIDKSEPYPADRRYKTDK